MNEWVNGVYVAVITAVVGGVVFLIRKVLTNDKEIEILKNEVKTRNEYRENKDEEFQEALQEIRADIKHLLSRP